jgi:hypothetical protein
MHDDKIGTGSITIMHCHGWEKTFFSSRPLFQDKVLISVRLEGSIVIQRTLVDVEVGHEVQSLKGKLPRLFAKSA